MPEEAALPPGILRFLPLNPVGIRKVSDVLRPREKETPESVLPGCAGGVDKPMFGCQRNQGNYPHIGPTPFDGVNNSEFPKLYK